ncbi:14.2 kDa protein [Human adenovirus 54]|uniref:14.2 kDa protein n=3 Tax=Human mastadenovirus D TaxID=130310 RepID=C5NMK0_9ADEN|nr:14.2 kDa protein [Human adenovirus 54]BAH84811.1 14.2 kDa protein [Human adenovirus 54]
MTMQTLLILLSLLSPALATFDYSKCKFVELWNFLNCYNATMDMPSYYLVIVGIVMVCSCTFFAIMIYPCFDLGWNSVGAFTYTLQNSSPAFTPPPRRNQFPLIQYLEEPPPRPPSTVSYFHITAGDD